MAKKRKISKGKLEDLFYEVAAEAENVAWNHGTYAEIFDDHGFVLDDATLPLSGFYDATWHFENDDKDVVIELKIRFTNFRKN